MSEHKHLLVSQLERECRSPCDEAERSFWSEIESRGTPLIEPDGDHSRVTFVYQLKDSEQHACVRGFVTTPVEGKLERVGLSSVASASFRIPNDRRFGYSFVADVPLIDPLKASPEEQRALGEHMATHPPLSDQYASCQREAQLEHSTYSEVELPDAPEQADFSTVSTGHLREIPRDERPSGQDRPLWIYEPDVATLDYLPVIYVISAEGYLNRMWANACIDNLVRRQAIPPVLGVFIDPAADRTIRNDFGFDQAFQDYLGELATWVDDNYATTREASHTAIAGASIGGLTALYSAHRRPDLFGSVVSQSGSFWMQSDSWSMTDLDNKDLRVYLEVGVDEHPTMMLEPNRKLHEHLLAQGIEVSYSEFPGGHDYVCWRGTFADGLIFAFGQ